MVRDDTGIASLSVAILRFDVLALPFYIHADFSSRARQQARDADRFAGHLAVAIVTIFHATHGFINFSKQERLALTQTQVQPMLFFGSGPIRRVGKAFLLIQTIFNFRLASQYLGTLLQQALAEEIELDFIHVGTLWHPANFALGGVHNWPVQS